MSAASYIFVCIPPRFDQRGLRPGVVVGVEPIQTERRTKECERAPIGPRTVGETAGNVMNGRVNRSKTSGCCP